LNHGRSIAAHAAHAYRAGENPAIGTLPQRRCNLLAAKRYLADCLIHFAGPVRGYPLAKSVQQARTREDVIALLDAACEALAARRSALTIARVMDRTLILLGEAGAG
jgi:hypothetical protein